MTVVTLQGSIIFFANVIVTLQDSVKFISNAIVTLQDSINILSQTHKNHISPPLFFAKIIIICYLTQ